MTTQSTDNCGRPQWMERRWLSKYRCQTKRFLKCSWYWDLFIKDTKNERTASTGGCNERERENFKSSDDSDYFIYHHKFDHALHCNGWTGGAPVTKTSSEEQKSSGPHGPEGKPLADVAEIAMPAVDNQKLLEEAQQRSWDEPPRFATSLD